MKYTITGDNLQFVNVQIEEGEEFLSEAGAMRYMTGNVRMEAKATGGIGGVFKRVLTQESLFQLKYHTEGGSGVLGLGGKCPGKIVDLDISKGTWIAQKSAYLGSEMDVKLDIAFQKKLGSMLFGGEGLILEKLTGDGVCFIAACGDQVIVDLKKGEQYKVSTGNAVAWQDTVSYDIAAAGGIKTALFGGEGLFVTTLTGPGKIILQSMTLADLAAGLIPYLPQNNK